MNQEFALHAEEMGHTLKELEEMHRQKLRVHDDGELRAALAEEKATLLEENLPQKAVEEFKVDRDFSVTAEKFLSDKIINFYENLSSQFQAVDPQFRLNQVEVMLDLLRCWTCWQRVRLRR